MTSNYQAKFFDKDMKKADLRRKTGVSPATIAKLTRGDDVKTSVLTRVCEVLTCDVSDIMNVVPDDSWRQLLKK